MPISCDAFGRYCYPDSRIIFVIFLILSVNMFQWGLRSYVRALFRSVQSQRDGEVIKWKHFSRYSPFVQGIHRSPVNSPHKGQWRGALMSSLIYAQINGWVNNREAGILRCHRAHYDVMGMAYVLNPFDNKRTRVIFHAHLASAQVKTDIIIISGTNGIFWLDPWKSRSVWQL